MRIVDSILSLLALFSCVLVGIALGGCSDNAKEDISEKVSVQYSIDWDTFIEEEDREKILQHAKALVSAASLRMTTGDYEDVDDTIEVAIDECTRLYEKHETGLRKYIRTSNTSIFIRPRSFTTIQSNIFKQLTTTGDYDKNLVIQESK